MPDIILSLHIRPHLVFKKFAEAGASLLSVLYERNATLPRDDITRIVTSILTRDKIRFQSRMSDSKAQDLDLDMVSIISPDNKLKMTGFVTL